MTKKIDNNFNLIERMDYGVKKGAANAILEHKMAGKSIFVLENDKVVEIPADKIEVPEVLPPSWL